MHICFCLFFVSILFSIQINCVTLLPHIGLDWNFRVKKNANIDSLIHKLRDLRFHQPTVIQRTVNNSQVEEKSRKESLKKFYLEQQSLFLKELVVPCLKTLKSSYKTPKTLEENQHTPQVSKVWDYKVSDDSNKLRCSVLSEVPKGTVLIRPIGSKAEFVSLPVLNNLFRTRANILKILYPKHEIKDLNELYKYASFDTILISQLCSNDKIRRLLVTLSLLYGMKLGKEVILDLIFFLIRSKFFWNQTVYSYWSRSISVPLPLLILTVNNILDVFLGIVSSLDDNLKEKLISVEGNLLNRDLRKRFTLKYVRDDKGSVRLHENYFD